jgi:hypothetical protein
MCRTVLRTCYAGHVASISDDGEVGMYGVEPTAADLAELDIDLRLGVEAWKLVFQIDGQSVDLVAPVLRLVYAHGYYHALTETTRGQLLRDHGFEVPDRGRA